MRKFVALSLLACLLSGCEEFALSGGDGRIAAKGGMLLQSAILHR